MGDVDGDLRDRRDRAIELVRRLLDYTPPPAPPPDPEAPPRPRWRWLATGGGLGAATVYPYGVALGLALMVWIVWSTFLFTGDQPGADRSDVTQAASSSSRTPYAQPGQVCTHSAISLVGRCG